MLIIYLFDNRDKSDYGNKVRYSHKTVHCGGYAPYKVEIAYCTDIYKGYIYNSVYYHSFVILVGEKFHTYLAVVCPAENGGKGKEYGRKGYTHTSDTGDNGIK